MVFLIGAGIALVIAVLAWTSLQTELFTNQVIADEASVLPENQPIAVNVSPMQLQDQYTTFTSYTGMIKPERQAQLAFEIPGTLKHIHVKNGDIVKKNQVIATLDTQTTDAQRKRLQASLKAAEARLLELNNGPRKQQIAIARQQVTTDKVRLAQAQMRFDQQDALTKKNAGNQFQADMASLELDALRATIKISEAMLEELEEGSRQELIEAQKAQVAYIKASLEENQTLLDKAKILAPFDGRVSARSVYLGAAVQPGQHVITLTDETHMRVEIGVPQNVIDHLSEGAKLDLSIGKYRLSLAYTAILPELSERTRTARMIFDFKNPGIRAIVGRIAELHVPDIDQRPGYLIPIASLRPDTHGLWFITVAQKNEANQWVAQKRYVQPLQVTSEYAYIQGQIEENDLLITDGSHRFAGGQLIQPVKETTAKQPSNDNTQQEG